MSGGCCGTDEGSGSDDESLCMAAVWLHLHIHLPRVPSGRQANKQSGVRVQSGRRRPTLPRPLLCHPSSRLNLPRILLLGQYGIWHLALGSWHWHPASGIWNLTSDTGTNTDTDTDTDADTNTDHDTEINKQIQTGHTISSTSHPMASSWSPCPVVRTEGYLVQESEGLVQPVLPGHHKTTRIRRA